MTVNYKAEGNGMKAAITAYFKALAFRKTTKILTQEGWQLAQAPTPDLLNTKHGILRLVLNSRQ
jgi:hypothetical protein